MHGAQPRVIGYVAPFSMTHASAAGAASANGPGSAVPLAHAPEPTLADKVAHYSATLMPAHLVHTFAHLNGALREISIHVHKPTAAQPHPPASEARMWRYQHFAHSEAFKRELTRHRVMRIDLGAYYSAPPSLERHRVGAYACSRELVFDVDADAYDGVRTCCRANTVCSACWPLLACAAECLDHVLRRQFDFKHVLHVFSGRRGVHVWVCDRRSTTLSEGARLEIVRLFGALRAAAATARRAFSRGERALVSVMRRHYETFVERQALAARTKPPSERASDAAVVLAMVPRLDTAITAQLAHLLRAPFSAHPSCGSLALPMPLEALCALDPATARVTAQALYTDANDELARRAFSASLRYMQNFIDDVRESVPQ